MKYQVHYTIPCVNHEGEYDHTNESNTFDTLEEALGWAIALNENEVIAPGTRWQILAHAVTAAEEAEYEHDGVNHTYLKTVEVILEL